jgi:hypothetical protein
MTCSLRLKAEADRLIPGIGNAEVPTAKRIREACAKLTSMSKKPSGPEKS